MRKKQTLYIAVICSEVEKDFEGLITSKRNRGDFASFIGTSQEEVIENALKARDAWTASGQYGPYEVYAGTISSKVKELRRYKLVAK